MRNYKVIAAICVCVPQRAKLRKDTVKPESWFMSGQISELVKGRFIAEVVEQVESVPDMVITSPEPQVDNVDLSKMSLSDLQELAVSMGIEYSVDATKKDLVKLLK